MAILVTGSAGHLGEALMRILLDVGEEPIGVDIKASAFTREIGSITDRAFVKRCMPGVHAVFHTAALHKPHVATHTRQDFVDTNITGFARYIVSATTPFTRDDAQELRTNAAAVVRRLVGVRRRAIPGRVARLVTHRATRQ